MAVVQARAPMGSRPRWDARCCCWGCCLCGTPQGNGFSRAFCVAVTINSSPFPSLNGKTIVVPYLYVKQPDVYDPNTFNAFTKHGQGSCAAWTTIGLVDTDLFGGKRTCWYYEPWIFVACGPTGIKGYLVLGGSPDGTTPTGASSFLAPPLDCYTVGTIGDGAGTIYPTTTYSRRNCIDVISSTNQTFTETVVESANTLSNLDCGGDGWSAPLNFSTTLWWYDGLTHIMHSAGLSLSVRISQVRVNGSGVGDDCNQFPGETISTIDLGGRLFNGLFENVCPCKLECEPPSEVSEPSEPSTPPPSEPPSDSSGGEQVFTDCADVPIPKAVNAVIQGGGSGFFGALPGCSSCLNVSGGLAWDNNIGPGGEPGYVWSFIACGTFVKVRIWCLAGGSGWQSDMCFTSGYCANGTVNVGPGSDPGHPGHIEVTYILDPTQSPGPPCFNSAFLFAG